MGTTGMVAGVSLSWGAATHVGMIRTVNEDALLCHPPVFVVADGMGGHAAGDVASSIVVADFAEAAGEPVLTGDQVLGYLRRVGERMIDSGRGDDELAMGSTVTGLALIDNGGRPSWLVFNVGDSRTYRMRRGVLEQLTHDHSVVQELVDSGEISAYEAADHPQRNIVTRALGVDDEVRPDLWVRSPYLGERFLLCTDGLHGEVPEDQLRSVLVDLPDPQVAAEELVRRSLDRGARDNVTAVVVDVLAIGEGTWVAEVTAPRQQDIASTLSDDSAEVAVPITGLPADVRVVAVDEESDAYVREMIIGPPEWGKGPEHPEGEN